MIPYLLMAASLYCLAASSPRGVIFFAPFMLVVGAFRVPDSPAVNVFLIPFVGVRWEL